MVDVDTDLSAASPHVLPHLQFTVSGESYVYAARTGALLQVDDAAREVLSSLGCGTGCAARADEARGEILDELVDAGVVGEAGGCVGSRAAASARPPFAAATLVLMLTERCNLACRYCYEAAAAESPCAAAPTPSRRMSVATALRAIDFLLSHAGSRSSVTVVFFGGEPLLELSTIRAAVAHARARAAALGKEVHFSLTTNGTLVTDEAVGFLREAGVSVCVSVDGPAPIHDRNRRFASGRGSYSEVRRGLSRLLAEGVRPPVAARVTLSRGAGDVVEIYDHLRGLGIDDVGFAPASASESSDVALTGAELTQVVAGFRRLADRYVEDVAARRVPGFSNLTQILGMVHRGGTPLPYPCGAAIGMVAADAEGALYPCHRLCSVAEPLGDLERGVEETPRRRFLDLAEARAGGECAGCWAAPFCAGGCYHDAQLRHGHLGATSTHHCTWIRALFGLGLETYVRIERETPTFLDVTFGERGDA
jgi:uncharacterized protein